MATYIRVGREFFKKTVDSPWFQKASFMLKPVGTIDEKKTASKVRAKILGKKEVAVEEKRVNKTVIRRRKKRVAKEPEAVGKAVSTEVTATEEATFNNETVESVGNVDNTVAEKAPHKNEQAQTDDSPSAKEDLDSVKETPPQIKTAEKKTEAVLKKTKKKDQKAKIIKPSLDKAVVVEPPKEDVVQKETLENDKNAADLKIDENNVVAESLVLSENNVPDEPVFDSNAIEMEKPAAAFETDDKKDAAGEEISSLKTASEGDAAAKIDPTKEGTTGAEKPHETVKEKTPDNGVPEKHRVSSADQKTSKSSSKKRKKKRDMPAKIISLPTHPQEDLKLDEVDQNNDSAVPDKPQQPDKPKKKVIKTVGKKDIDKNDDATDISRKKKKGKRGVVINTEPEGKTFKKKGGFKRKEIIEGADLYSGGKTRGKKGKKGRAAQPQKPLKPQITIPKAHKRRIKIDDTIVISDLAKRMGIKANEMITKLMAMGVMVTVNQTIDYETASLVASEFSYEVEKAAFEEETIIKQQEDTPDKMEERPPVVTIMGHVDHGKTSLLDVIRKSRITEGEAGGITQHIGAYNVTTKSGQIVFLDTPGHEAFTAMRSRGAKVTDIVILVVAADDGVMPQTIEAINHSKAAGVPIIVAVNKIDKPGADPDKIKRQLGELNLVPEDWGGDTIFVNVSAKQKIGIDDLLEMVLLQAEVLELKANPDKLARGHVIESKMDPGRGPVATILIQEGTLSSGESLVCGIHYGKVRAMLNDVGQNVDKAGPSMPVEVLGLSGVPMAGDEMMGIKDDKSAKQVSQYRSQKQRSLELAKSSRTSLEELFEKMKEGEVKDLNLIIRADVQGSIEALKDSLTKLSTDEVKINVVHSAPGTITETDVSLASVSNAIILGFNVRPNPKVIDMANEENVDMRFYNIIYEAIKDVKDAMTGMMESTYEERVVGRAEVRDTFHVPKVGVIAGSHVTDGRIERGLMARLLREGVIVFDGKISSLKRFKDDVKEVKSGYECGIAFENFNDIKLGDVIECYYMEEIKPEMV